MNPVAFVQLWLAERRVEHLREEVEYHRTLAISLADQAIRLERDVATARLEMQS